MYCPTCGTQRHEGSRFCPQCGHAFEARPATSPVRPAVPEPQPSVHAASVWMAITSLVLAIVTLLALLSGASDLDTLGTLGELESLFGGHARKHKLAEEAANTAAGGLLLGLPALVLGIVSLAQRRGGRGMAIAGVVISGIDLVLTLGLFGMSTQ